MVEVSYDMCLSEGSTGCVTASVNFFFLTEECLQLLSRKGQRKPGKLAER